MLNYVLKAIGVKPRPSHERLQSCSRDRVRVNLALTVRDCRVIELAMFATRFYENGDDEMMDLYHRLQDAKHRSIEESR